MVIFLDYAIQIFYVKNGDFLEIRNLEGDKLKFSFISDKDFSIEINPTETCKTGFVADGLLTYRTSSKVIKIKVVDAKSDIKIVVRNTNKFNIKGFNLN
ncbi:hypothetical protein JCM14244_09890 [Venenivibrio stagnispumantis]|uniref:Uncharacterized protein n=1 Tax=Venenivibrio stagnispumantis TaxID=407998 RepID=A0AA46AET6_9AQUI|nr:hypothetical protein [Venenivibrio stagnispumantis]MCW4573626.1 hypothetical protein [Venenivibrio stagnispumantis]SMP14218.1 hypothetical protein SAMN06264868_11228 [Venenivibrio stagnispumantis]